MAASAEDLGDLRIGQAALGTDHHRRRADRWRRSRRPGDRDAEVDARGQRFERTIERLDHGDLGQIGATALLGRRLDDAGPPIAALPLRDRSLGDHRVQVGSARLDGHPHGEVHRRALREGEQQVQLVGGSFFDDRTVGDQHRRAVDDVREDRGRLLAVTVEHDDPLALADPDHVEEVVSDRRSTVNGTPEDDDRSDRKRPHPTLR